VRVTPEQVVFKVLRKDPKTQADTAVLTASGDDPKGFRVPRGLSVKDGVYTARLSVNGVQLQGSVQSPQVPLPVCPLVGLKTPIVTLELVRDPANDRTCGEPAKLRFSLCLDSRVTILVDGRPLVAAVDGAPQNVAIANMTLTARDHVVDIPAELLGHALDARAPFQLRAFAFDAHQLKHIPRADI